MKHIDLTNVKEAGQSSRLPAGVYACIISNVEDVEDREYLKVSYDIAEGEYKGHFSALREDHPDWKWVGAYVKSYKTSALSMFKRFCSAVSKSNGNYVFDGGAVNADERTLIGKKLGLVLREEEYYRNDGEVGTRLTVYSEVPLDKISTTKVPEPVKLPSAPEPAKADPFLAIPDGMDEEVPF